MNSADLDYTPVTGGVPLREERVRKDILWPSSVKIESQLDLHLVRLWALHPKLRERFDMNQFGALNEEAKEALLVEFNEALGIAPLSSLKT
jgi:hypothetical protein